MAFFFQKRVINLENYRSSLPPHVKFWNNLSRVTWKTKFLSFKNCWSPPPPNGCSESVSAHSVLRACFKNCDFQIFLRKYEYIMEVLIRQEFAKNINAMTIAPLAIYYIFVFTIF